MATTKIAGCCTFVLRGCWEQLARSSCHLGVLVLLSRGSRFVVFVGKWFWRFPGHICARRIVGSGIFFWCLVHVFAFLIIFGVLKVLVSLLALIILIGPCTALQGRDQLSRESRDGNSRARVGISGRVVDFASGRPVEYATLSLRVSGESVVIEGTVSDQGGRFSLLATQGVYSLEVDFLGYHTFFLKVSVEEKWVELGDILLRESQDELDEVVVERDRTYATLEIDKRVINIGKDLTNTGGTAEDILGNLPSVSVDPEGNVTLRGSQQVRILINGRPSSMMGLSGSDGLKLIPSSQVDRVELITNPSAKYEAQGSGGIINIILKDDSDKKGLSGVVNAQSGYPNNLGFSSNLAYTRGRVKTFLGVGVGHRDAPGRYSMRQTFYRDNSYLTTEGDLGRSSTTYSLRTGSSFEINDRTSLSASLEGRLGDEDNHRGNLFTDYMGDGTISVIADRIDREKEKQTNLGANLGFIHNFNEDKDHSMEVEFQLESHVEVEKNQISESNPQDSPVISDKVSEAFYNDEGEQRWTLTADYSLPLGPRRSLEIGARGQIRKTFNDYQLTRYEGSNPVVDPMFSNKFLYDERISASYAIYHQKSGKFSWSAGLRFEGTSITTELEETVGKRSSSYGNLFPSAHLSYELYEESFLQLSHSRKIHRPWFRALNPLSGYSNNRSLRLGNPSLMPEFSNRFEAGFLQNIRPGSIYYGVYGSITQDKISYVSIGEGDRTVHMPENVGQTLSAGVELTSTLDMEEMYSLNTNLNLFYAKTSGSTSVAAVEVQTYSLSTRLTGTMNPLPGLKVQVTYFYKAPERQPTRKSRSTQRLDLGVSGDLLKGRATLRGGIRDVFNTSRRRFKAYNPAFLTEADFLWRIRSFNISFEYRIGERRSRHETDRRAGRHFSSDE